jgi:hypothetical protein
MIYCNIEYANFSTSRSYFHIFSRSGSTYRKNRWSWSESRKGSKYKSSSKAHTNNIGRGELSYSESKNDNRIVSNSYR